MVTTKRQTIILVGDDGFSGSCGGSSGGSGGGSGGGSMEIYKCASVDTDNKTWAGYLAVLTDGVYIFSSTVTENLTYGNGYTPVPGSIYDKEAMVTVLGLWSGLPAEGLVLHVPFTSQNNKAVTGQDISYNGTVNFADNWGTLSDGATADVSGTLDWGGNWTFTVNFKASDSGECGIFGTQNLPYDFRILLLRSGNLEVNIEGGQIASGSSYKDGKSHFMVLTGDGSNCYAYVDGIFVGETYYGQSSTKAPTIGWADGSGATSLRGIRFYSRILSIEEQQALMEEYTE